MESSRMKLKLFPPLPKMLNVILKAICTFAGLDYLKFSKSVSECIIVGIPIRSPLYIRGLTGWLSS